MEAQATQDHGTRWGSAEAGQYFRYMAEFVGFTAKDAEAIKETNLIIEKYIPEIVGRFYTQLLSYPPTRKIFQAKDGSIDQDYLQLRMHHLTNFWRRTATGVYDDDYARFVDYVGRAHTNRGADPKIFIPERYVIGQVGLVQQAIGEALYNELHDVDPELEGRASRAWNLLMMVILEMLARAYFDERAVEGEGSRAEIDGESIRKLAVQIYERNVGMYRSIGYKEVNVAREEEIPDGERKIIEVDGVSIGVFHHKGSWYALHNSCLHRGGPVCSGTLEGDVITCPWHGYQYYVTNGELLLDASAHLETYPVTVRNGDVYLTFPTRVMDDEMVQLEQPVQVVVETIPLEEPGTAATGEKRDLADNEFFLSELKPGEITLVYVDGDSVAVYNVDGNFYATQDECTHAFGPLNEGYLDGPQVTCPWHDSCFDVRDGSVCRGPAKDALKTYQVILDGEVGRAVAPEG